MATAYETYEELVVKAKLLFEKRFSSSPRIAVYAPGRVNIIGEHTDYNCGYVLPMALPLVTVIVGEASCNTKKCCIESSSMIQLSDAAMTEFDLPSNNTNKLTPSEPQWANYVKGVITYFHSPVPGFNAVIASSVPIGSGLSSSAALEVATYTFLEALTKSKAPSLLSKALACQKAEHEFAHVPCGIMDQFVSTMGQEGAALLIDCRSLTSEAVPLRDESVVFVVTNSHVRHALTGSEYPSRKAQCERAATLLGKPSLRDANLEDLNALKDKLDDVSFRRARHVVSEILRTAEASRLLSSGDYNAVGRLMNESHKSLRDDFEVSCDALDSLVEIAQACEGVFGSRLTGAGFGGCTVTLVKRENVKKLIEAIRSSYVGMTTFYVCAPSDGARIVDSC